MLLHAAARGIAAFEEDLQIAESMVLKGLKLPDNQLISEMRSLAQLSVTPVRSDDCPQYVDVFHLAFSQLGFWRKYSELVPAAGSGWLYRGQASHTWEVGPSIYRAKPGETLAEETIREEAAKVCQTARAIKPGRNFKQAVAIAQHYSKALNVRTWLADFTRDPWIALFFATDGAQNGQVGIVWSINPGEFKRKFPSRLQLKVPRGVKRIANQKGVFISATHPVIFEQYVPFGRELTFNQVPGLVFEDESMGVTRDLIYPKEDDILDRLSK